MHLLLVAFLAFGLATFNAGLATQNQSENCSNAMPGQFSVCAEESNGTDGSGSTGTGGVLMRECKYYANGTIDVPTMTVITAWVPSGSRLCLGDAMPDQSGSSSSWSNQVKIELRDKFTAFASRPTASWTPNAEVELEDMIELKVFAQTESVSGSLLNRPAQIRFRPMSARWEISDGSNPFGFRASHSFNAAGIYVAIATVTYEVDYKLSAKDWVMNAARWELSANKLNIVVIERERRTLLVG